MKHKKKKQVKPKKKAPEPFVPPMRVTPEPFEVTERDAITGRATKSNPLSRKNLSRYEMDILFGGIDIEPEQKEEARD